jgi:hypothetical protein
MQFAADARRQESTRTLAEREAYKQHLAQANSFHSTGASISVNPDGTSSYQNVGHSVYTQDMSGAQPAAPQGGHQNTALVVRDAGRQPIGMRAAAGNDIVDVPGYGETSVRAALAMGVVVRTADGGIAVPGAAPAQTPATLHQEQEQAQQTQATPPELAPEYAEISGETQATTAELRTVMGEDRLGYAAEMVVLNGYSDETVSHIAEALSVPAESLAEHLGPAVQEYQRAADTAVERVLGKGVDLDDFYTAASEFVPELVNRAVGELLRTGSTALFSEIARTHASALRRNLR